MKANLTEMVFILDRSGSMERLTRDTVGGFNSMIEAQKKEEGEAYITTVLFNNDYEILHNHVNIQEVGPLIEYLPYGTTALLDALGNTINMIRKRLSDTPEEERPSKVIFVIVTDGIENASVEFTKAQVKEMIQHQQDKYSWTFMFLGANMDAVSEAGGLGINTDFAKTYTANSRGTQSVYTTMASTMSCMRSVDFDSKDTRSNGYQIVKDSLDKIE